MNIKKYAITACFMTCLLQGMLKDEIIQVDPTARLDKELAKKAFQWLSFAGINTQNRAILLLDGGELMLPIKLAKKASAIFMLYEDEKKLAEKMASYGNLSNFNSAQSSLHNFAPKDPYDLALGFNILSLCHIALDYTTQQQSLVQLNNTLLIHGEFVDTMFHSLPPVHTQVIKALSENIHPFVSSITMSFAQYLAQDRDTGEQRLNTLLTATGFKIITKGKKTLKVTLQSQLELIDFIENFIPCLNSKFMPHFIRLWIVNKYLEHLVPKLKKNDKNQYIMPLIVVQMIHAKKIKEVSHGNSLNNGL